MYWYVSIYSEERFWPQYMYPKLRPNKGYRWCPLGKLSHLGQEQLMYCSPGFSLPSTCYSTIQICWWGKCGMWIILWPLIYLSPIRWYMGDVLSGYWSGYILQLCLIPFHPWSSTSGGRWSCPIVCSEFHPLISCLISWPSCFSLWLHVPIGCRSSWGKKYDLYVDTILICCCLGGIT